MENWVNQASVLAANSSWLPPLFFNVFKLWSLFPYFPYRFPFSIDYIPFFTVKDLTFHLMVPFKNKQKALKT